MVHEAMVPPNSLHQDETEISACQFPIFKQSICDMSLYILHDPQMTLTAKAGKEYLLSLDQARFSSQGQLRFTYC